MRAVRPFRAWGLLVVLVLSLQWSHGQPATAASTGTAQDGALVDGFEVPFEGVFHRFLQRSQSRRTHFTTLEVAALLWRSAKAVGQALPGARLLIGDCSLSKGGAVERHRSHRSGRDVDLLFYVLDAKGKSIEARGFEVFDGDGKCAREGCELRLDVARTWRLVRTLLASRRPAVQYIFISDPLKSLLIRWAVAHKEHPEILRRAQFILRQPSDSAHHDDHMHVRTFCSARDLAAGCEDGGTRWRWVDAQGRAHAIR